MRERSLLAVVVPQLTRAPTPFSFSAPRAAGLFTSLHRTSSSGQTLHRQFSYSRQYLAPDHKELAKSLNQKSLNDQEAELNDGISQEKEKQVRTPWHREGSSVPPVEQMRSPRVMTKGMANQSNAESCSKTVVQLIILEVCGVIPWISANGEQANCLLPRPASSN